MPVDPTAGDDSGMGATATENQAIRPDALDARRGHVGFAEISTTPLRSGTECYPEFAWHPVSTRRRAIEAQRVSESTQRVIQRLPAASRGTPTLLRILK